MCNLIAGRCIEPFTSAADCQPSGPKFVKNSKRLMEEAKRAEKLLPLSRSRRIEALGVKTAMHPSVVLQSLSQEHVLSVSGNDDVSDDHATNVDRDTPNKTVAIASAGSKKIVQASKKAPVHALGEKKEIKRQVRKSEESPVAKKNYSDKNGSVDVVESLSDVEPECDSETMKIVTKTESKKRVEASDKTSTKAHGKQNKQKKEMKRQLKNTKNGSVDVVESLSNVEPGCDSETMKIVVTNTESKKRVEASDKTLTKAHGKLKNTEEKQSVVDDDRVRSVKPESDSEMKTMGTTNTKNRKAFWSVTESGKGRKGAETEGMEYLKGAAASNVFPASLTKAENRKRKVSSSDEYADPEVSEHGSHPDVDGTANPDVSLAFRQTSDIISPTKFQKMQQSCSGQSQVDGVDETSMNVTPDGTGPRVVPQQVMGSARVTRGVSQRGRPVSRRLHSNVGNRVNPAAGSQALVSDGDGFPLVRGRGRGRRGSGVVGLTSVHQGRGVAAGPYGARGAALGRGVQQRGMPIRGRGRVAGGPLHGYPEETVMRNSFGLGDSQMNAFGHLPHTVMIDASDANDSQVLKPALSCASARSGECFNMLLCSL